MSTDVTEFVGLHIEPFEGESLAQKIVRAGQAKAISKFAAGLEKQAKADLKAAAEADVVRAGGGGFSRTVDGVRATLTDPQPKPQVTDPDAFRAWWVESGRERQVREYVEVIDHAGLVQAINHILGQKPTINTDDPGGFVEMTGKDAEELAQLLVESLKVTAEVLLPEGALDSLTASGEFAATDDGLVEVATGEMVPGVDCYRATPQVSITPTPQAKARDAAIVRSYFGLPVELPGGGR